MFALLRSKFGPVVVSIIIGFIAFVFIFFGVYSPRTGGYQGGGSAATVNGEVVTLPEFNRAYQQRLQFYQNMMKGKADPALLENLGLRKAVIDDLVRQKAILQESRRMGFDISDEEVAARIKALPYFQKDGKFDKDVYKKMLEANGYSPGRFEDSLREDSIAQKGMDYFRGRIKVSEQEVKEDFFQNGDQRQVEYVVVKGDKKNEKDSKELVEKILSKIKSGGVAGLLKEKKLKQMTSPKFTQEYIYIEGVGDLPDLRTEAFKADSPLAQGAKLFESYGNRVIAWNLKSYKVDLAAFEKEKEKLLTQTQSKKDKVLFDEWSQEIMARAKVSVNPGLLVSQNPEDEGAAPMAPSGPEEL